MCLLGELLYQKDRNWGNRYQFRKCEKWLDKNSMKNRSRLIPGRKTELQVPSFGSLPTYLILDEPLWDILLPGLGIKHNASGTSPFFFNKSYSSAYKTPHTCLYIYIYILFVCVCVYAYVDKQLHIDNRFWNHEKWKLFINFPSVQWLSFRQLKLASYWPRCLRKYQIREMERFVFYSKWPDLYLS